MVDHYIPLSVPSLKGNELKYVTEAIQTEWVSSGGQFINDFEKEIASFVNAEDAVAVQSGTAGLHLSLLEAGVQAGEEVLVPTLTFIAAVNPIRYIGAEPVFLDANTSLGVDPVKLEKFLEEECTFDNNIVTNKKTGKKIRALIVVHVFGNLVDMEEIMTIAEKYNLKVIEDATEALGTKYISGKYAGMYAGTIGHYGCYSFNGNKIMTTGGGGMIVAREQKELDHMRYLSTQAKDNPTNFIHNEVGYNYRMTNVQAALGVGQIEQLGDFIQAKNDNYDLYKELFADNNNVELLPFKEEIYSNKWFYALYIKGEPNIQELMDKLEEMKIQTQPIWGLIHQQKPYLTNEAYDITVALDYAKHVINIPCSTNLKEEEIRYVAASVNELTKG